ncbi:MAG: hypothetical protein QOD63_2994, partial [Actinomycetota bacterium]|nr:hypothetical protein [Actinomycetota bacterium]
MQYRVLGPLQVDDEGAVLELGRPKQRAVLAVLVVEANGVVSLDRLIDLLWGDGRPARSTASLQVYVSNLRKILEPGREPRAPSTILLTRAPGYLLRVGPEDIDGARFERMAAEGRRLLDTGRPAEARAMLHDALALWRGPARADFAYETYARAEAARLDELRVVALEDGIEAEMV